MLLDSQNLFSDDQSLAIGTIYSENIIKFGNGDISYLPLLIQITNEFSNATSLKVIVQTSQSADFTDSKDLVEAKMEKDDLKQGAVFPISYMPKGNKGYIRLCYILEGDETETTGKITAGVIIAHDTTYAA